MKNKIPSRVFSLFTSFLFLASSFFLPPAQAAIPKLLTYQGILKDSAGNFLTGTYSMTFKIYDASTGGNNLWTETQSTVSVSSGRFTVQLGSVTALNLGFSADYWLGIKVGTDAEMSPRVRLTSSGYSLMAEDVTGGKLTGAQHAANSHMNIEGVRSAHTNIAKTNFKLDAYTAASANSMGDLIIDSFNDATGIDDGQSSNYTWRGSPNYDVVAGSIGGIDSNTVLMLHANGTNGSSAFTDSSNSPKSVTAVGNAQITTAQKKFGTASGLFDGAGDYLSITADSPDFDFGTGDFTVDFWVRFNRTPAQTGVCQNLYSADNYVHAVTQCYDNRIYVRINSLAAFDVAWSPVAGTWYHLALVRSGTTLKIYVDGTSLGSTTYSSSVDVTSLVRLGVGDGNGSYYLDGWLDEVRVSKGVARWTSNFTPPTSEYTAPGGSTGTVISTRYDEPSVFSEALVIGSETLGTGSITYHVSRNNGTNWTQCTNEVVCDLSAQPSGSQLRWKAVITGNAELDAMGVAV